MSGQSVFEYGHQIHAWRRNHGALLFFQHVADDSVLQPDDTSDASYQAATVPDNQATADKRAFVNLWNPIASQYGLSTYQQGQL